MTRKQIVSTQYIRLLYGHGTKIPYAHTHLSCIFDAYIYHSFRSINRQLLADGRSACTSYSTRQAEESSENKTDNLLYAFHSVTPPPLSPSAIASAEPKCIEYIRSFSVFSLLDNTNLYVNKFSFTFSFQILSAVVKFCRVPRSAIRSAPVFHFR